MVAAVGKVSLVWLLAAKLRSSVFHMCQCVSTSPGNTII